SSAWRSAWAISRCASMTSKRNWMKSRAVHSRRPPHPLVAEVRPEFWRIQLPAALNSDESGYGEGRTNNDSKRDTCAKLCGGLRRAGEDRRQRAEIQQVADEQRQDCTDAERSDLDAQQGQTVSLRPHRCGRE